MSPRHKRRSRKRAQRRGSKRRFAISRRVALFLLALVGGTVAWQAATWPDVRALARENPETTAFLDRAGERLAREGREAPSLHFVPRPQISLHFQHAVIASEDMGFFRHQGFDLGEIKAAAMDTLTEGKRLRGASTITQQLAKNLWLSPSRSPLRKVKEVMLTRQLESQLGKARILELYCNVVELGDGIYGVENAAQHYFGKPASRLGPREAAQLAASLPSPRRWHPGSTSKTYRNRTTRLEARVQESTWLRKHLETL